MFVFCKNYIISGCVSYPSTRVQPRPLKPEWQSQKRSSLLSLAITSDVQGEGGEGEAGAGGVVVRT